MAKKKLFFVRARVSGIVFAPIYAESLEEASALVKSDGFEPADWQDEEWDSTPCPVGVFDPESKMSAAV